MEAGRNEQTPRFAQMFAALGTEPRLRIIRLLLSAHPEGLVVGEIQAELGIPPSTLSHHLDKLKNEDLVNVRRESTFLRYTANTEALRELLTFLYAECCTRNKVITPEEIGGRAGRGARILVLCTGNSARSQMAEGFLKSFDARLEVHSAGTHPSPCVNPFAIQAMKEVGIDISGGLPKRVDSFLGQPFDYVITVCGDADSTCPTFRGKVGQRVHLGFPDPAAATGTDAEKLAAFRKVRDDIGKRFREFYETEIKKSL